MIRRRSRSQLDTISIVLIISLLVLIRSTGAYAVAASGGQEPLGTSTNGSTKKQSTYALGGAIPVSCLNRTIEHGEHISDEKGQLQYIPFSTCNETGKPLELQFGVEKDFNCTIPFITDEFFHLLEFYIHNDAPMTCRIPARPLVESGSSLSSSLSTTSPGDANTDNHEYIPLVFALSGVLQLSHLHVANNLNILLHAAPRLSSPGVIDSGTAYSTSPTTRHTRIVIGSALPLRLSVRWYPTSSLPSGWTAALGRHLTFVYCALSVGATVVACLAYFRAVDFPRKFRRYDVRRLAGDGLGHGDTPTASSSSSSPFLPTQNGPGRSLGGYAFPAITSTHSTTTSLGNQAGPFNFGRGNPGKID